MFKPLAKFLVLLFVIPVFMLIGLLKVQPVLSKTPDIPPLSQPTLVATAALPPSLGKSVLGGKPVYVLYVTRAEDTGSGALLSDL
ncbi:hypothetical protein K9N68_21825 [Kovacikia minuta CCNUW1]|uniref:hypothetical protein n=1 Tax=Kovacikia minuta TaxID=2931930 RepID=UPI001CCEFE00|nr:hypothetical protein [Kovacikia minuta]UBF24330.1 hypothetical protein K9N68_21825 [Kovacikia minuta CCNUW1]